MRPKSTGSMRYDITFGILPAHTKIVPLLNQVLRTSRHFTTTRNDGDSQAFVLDLRNFTLLLRRSIAAAGGVPVHRAQGYLMLALIYIHDRGMQHARGPNYLCLNGGACSSQDRRAYSPINSIVSCVFFCDIITSESYEIPIRVSEFDGAQEKSGRLSKSL